MKTKPRIFFFSLPILFGLLGMISFVGCDDSDPSLGHLSGLVKFEQKALSGALLQFVTVREDGSECIRMASVNETGGYQINDLPPGNYQVSVSTETLEGLPDFVALPKKFADPKTSGLTCVVKAGKQTHPIEFE